ncbi:hypothetical protein ARGLB_014_00390 [Arthrobacter globiformis NBRC 12137]|jgi:hypothetical protein|uniref:Uncharacterized protein n=1 Tax=Arthrobacter globiformis (strain ATCC 8010 / DSM 20124 / JCM 1332 / NBRC 12137 / NCIMB 8907 / NRRL B-2979 / 168) TaxID=1077972 RepID=H0QHU5_ARTG1|nr:hypothetical protein ARGLB_014_00390 [Arthrobacter globiformis NBRC 12137]
MQQRPKPLSLKTAMHPAREHDVTFLQKIPPTPDGTHPGFGCPPGDAVPAADASADDGCTGCTGKPGTFRKSIPPGTVRGSSPCFSAAKLPGA